MNNQRNNNNNRRRGRGNNRGNGGGNGNPVNRIDSRARGNAPQMLEKYRKLAHEASLNDDRVQTEYYLQFADHYFRVIADSKAQKDEQQGRQRTEREGEEGDDFYGDDRFDAPRRPQQQARPDREMDRAPADDDGEEGQRGSEGGLAEDENPFLAQQQRQPRQNRDNRDGREGGGRERRENREDRPAREPRDSREERPSRDARPNRDRPRRRPDGDDDGAPVGLNPDMLPPSISRSSDDGAPAPEVASDTASVPASVPAADAAPAKPRRTRRPRRTDGDGEGGGEELAAVG